MQNRPLNPKLTPDELQAQIQKAAKQEQIASIAKSITEYIFETPAAQLEKILSDKHAELQAQKQSYSGWLLSKVYSYSSDSAYTPSFNFADNEQPLTVANKKINAAIDVLNSDQGINFMVGVFSDSFTKEMEIPSDLYLYVKTAVIGKLEGLKIPIQNANIGSEKVFADRNQLDASSIKVAQTAALAALLEKGRAEENLKERKVAAAQTTGRLQGNTKALIQKFQENSQQNNKKPNEDVKIKHVKEVTVKPAQTANQETSQPSNLKEKQEAGSKQSAAFIKAKQQMIKATWPSARPELFSHKKTVSENIKTQAIDIQEKLQGPRPGK